MASKRGVDYFCNFYFLKKSCKMFRFCEIMKNKILSLVNDIKDPVLNFLIEKIDLMNELELKKFYFILTSNDTKQLRKFIEYEEEHIVFLYRKLKISLKKVQLLNVKILENIEKNKEKKYLDSIF